MADDIEKYRPPAHERWTDGMRTDPVRIAVRTRWLYSEFDPRIAVPEGRTRHAFNRSGIVTASDVPSRYEHQQSVASHVHRAVETFGDDKDLVIEVRLAADLEEAEAVADPAASVAGRFDACWRRRREEVGISCWPDTPEQIVREALREYVGDGEGADDAVFRHFVAATRAAVLVELEQDIERERDTPARAWNFDSFKLDGRLAWRAAMTTCADMVRKRTSQESAVIGCP